MPHYYFDIKDGHTLIDPSGLNFKTDDAAIARAEAIAIVVAIDTPLVDPKRHIAVLNGSRKEIFRVPVTNNECHVDIRNPGLSSSVPVANLKTQRCSG